MNQDSPVTLKTYFCSCCRAHFSQSEPYYEVKITMTSAKGQIVSGSGGSDSSEEIERLLSIIEKSDPKKLEEDVFLEREFCLCPSCREKVLGLLNL